MPLSVTAISGDRLDALQRNEIADLAKTLPGLTYKGGATDNGRSLQIRGIGTASFSRGVERSAGMINIVTRAPTEELEWGLRAGFGLAHANQLAFNYTRRFGVTLSVNF